MTCFQVAPPPHSHFIFISGCLGRILASKHCFIHNVHMGTAIIPAIINSNHWFPPAECTFEPIKLSLGFHLDTAIHLISHRGLNVNFPGSFKITRWHVCTHGGEISTHRHALVHGKHRTYSSLPPQATAKWGSEHPPATPLSSVWLLNY